MISRKEYRVRVLENRVVTREKAQVEIKRQENGENCIMRSLITCTLHNV
jgi:hypothetical protein